MEKENDVNKIIEEIPTEEVSIKEITIEDVSEEVSIEEAPDVHHNSVDDNSDTRDQYKENDLQNDDIDECKNNYEYMNVDENFYDLYNQKSQKFRFEYNRQLRIREIKKELYNEDILSLDDCFPKNNDFPKLTKTFASLISDLVPIHADPSHKYLVAYSLLLSVVIACQGKIKIYIPGEQLIPVTAAFLCIRRNNSYSCKPFIDFLIDPFDSFCCTANTLISEKISFLKMQNKAYANAAKSIMKRDLSLALKDSNNLSLEEVYLRQKKIIDKHIKAGLNFMPQIDIPHKVQLLIEKANHHQLFSIMYEQKNGIGVIQEDDIMIKNIFLSNKKEDLSAYALNCFKQSMISYVKNGKTFTLIRPSLSMLNYVSLNFAMSLYKKEVIYDQDISSYFVPFFMSKYKPEIQFDNMTNMKLKSCHLYYNKLYNATKYFRSLPFSQWAYLDRDAISLFEKFKTRPRFNSTIMYKNDHLAKSGIYKLTLVFAWCIHVLEYDEQIPNTSVLDTKINAEQMSLAIKLSKNLYNHFDFAIGKKGLGAYIIAKKILKCISRLDINARNDILYTGLSSTYFQQYVRTYGKSSEKKDEINNALLLLEKHNYLQIFDYGDKNWKLI